MTHDSMEVTITVTRTYKMDTAKCLAESGFAPPDASATEFEKRRWLRETFYELCGFDRDEDHVDGSFVRNTGEVAETEFDWPEELLS